MDAGEQFAKTNPFDQPSHPPPETIDFAAQAGNFSAWIFNPLMLWLSWPPPIVKKKGTRIMVVGAARLTPRRNRAKRMATFTGAQAPSAGANGAGASGAATGSLGGGEPVLRINTFAANNSVNGSIPHHHKTSTAGSGTGSGSPLLVTVQSASPTHSVAGGGGGLMPNLSPQQSTTDGAILSSASPTAVGDAVTGVGLGPALHVLTGKGIEAGVATHTPSPIHAIAEEPSGPPPPQLVAVSGINSARTNSARGATTTTTTSVSGTTGGNVTAVTSLTSAATIDSSAGAAGGVDEFDISGARNSGGTITTTTQFSAPSSNDASTNNNKRDSHPLAPSASSS